MAHKFDLFVWIKEKHLRVCGPSVRKKKCSTPVPFLRRRHKFFVVYFFLFIFNVGRRKADSFLFRLQHKIRSFLKGF